LSDIGMFRCNRNFSLQGNRDAVFTTSDLSYSFWIQHQRIIRKPLLVTHYEKSTYPIGGDIAAVYDKQVAALGGPGSGFDGAEWLALAYCSILPKLCWSSMC